MKVTFRPSIDEHVEFLAERQKQVQSSVSHNFTWLLFIFNLAVVPAIFIFNDFIWLAITVFAVNAIVMIILLSWQQKSGLRKYYEDVWPHLENHICEIRIDEKGFECEHAGNLNSYLWKNVRAVGATAKLIFFDVGPTQVLISKRGFADEQNTKEFIDLAQKYKSA